MNQTIGAFSTIIFFLCIHRIGLLWDATGGRLSSSEIIITTTITKNKDETINEEGRKERMKESKT